MTPSFRYLKWDELLPKVELGPNSRHLFKIPQTDTVYTHLKLNVYPDGGVVRKYSLFVHWHKRC